MSLQKLLSHFTKIELQELLINTYKQKKIKSLTKKKCLLLLDDYGRNKVLNNLTSAQMTHLLTKIKLLPTGSKSKKADRLLKYLDLEYLKAQKVIFEKQPNMKNFLNCFLKESLLNLLKIICPETELNSQVNLNDIVAELLKYENIKVLNTFTSFQCKSFLEDWKCDPRGDKSLRVHRINAYLNGCSKEDTFRDGYKTYSLSPPSDKESYQIQKATLLPKLPQTCKDTEHELVYRQYWLSRWLMNGWYNEELPVKKISQIFIAAENVEPAGCERSDKNPYFFSPDLFSSDWANDLIEITTLEVSFYMRDDQGYYDLHSNYKCSYSDGDIEEEEFVRHNYCLSKLDTGFGPDPMSFLRLSNTPYRNGDEIWIYFGIRFSGDKAQKIAQEFEEKDIWPSIEEYMSCFEIF